MMDKPLHEWTFEEVVRYSQGNIILEIPTGGFNDAVWTACELALRWKFERDQYIKKGTK
jgi:hypothetical protein